MARAYSSKQAEERSGAAINQGYINSLLPTGGPMKTEICLADFERFDDKSEEMTIKFTGKTMSIAGEGELPQKAALYINKAGSTVVLIKDDEKGFEIRKVKGYRKIIGAGPVRNALIGRGVSMPVSGVLVYDPQLGGWVARLNKGGGKSGKD